MKLWIRQGEKRCLPAGQLVSRPGAGGLALLCLVAVTSVIPAHGIRGLRTPGAGVRGLRAAGTGAAGNGTAVCRRFRGLADCVDGVLVRVAGDCINSRRRRYSAPVYPVSSEGELERVFCNVIHKMTADFCRKTMQKRTTDEPTWFVVGGKEGQHLGHQGGR